MGKDRRQKTLKKIIKQEAIISQEQLLVRLISKGFETTQATLSRDMKELKIVKAPDSKGTYIYQLPEEVQNYDTASESISSLGFDSIEFSGHLAVIKTRPGYAMAIATEIDKKATAQILGTVAGDDTILLIPRENISREAIIDTLSTFIPNIK